VHWAATASVIETLTTFCPFPHYFECTESCRRCLIMSRVPPNINKIICKLLTQKHKHPPSARVRSQVRLNLRWEDSKLFLDLSLALNGSPADTAHSPSVTSHSNPPSPQIVHEDEFTTVRFAYALQWAQPTPLRRFGPKVASYCIYAAQHGR
jgi:hypothetical protein